MSMIHYVRKYVNQHFGSTIKMSNQTTGVKFTKEEKHILFDLILDNFPGEEKAMKYVTIYNKIAGVCK